MNSIYIGQPVSAPVKAPRQRPGISGRVVLVIAALLVAVLVGVGLIVANRDTSGPLSQRLSLRLDALQAILKDGKKNASSDKLSKVTAEASLLLAGDKTAITSALPKSKVKVPATLTASESSTSSIERLKNAKINAAYDSAYASELTAKFETTNALIAELHKATRSKSLKEALNTAHIHIAQLQKDLAAN